MSGRILQVNGRKVWTLEKGDGPPLLYLHGFADVHSVTERWLGFHELLSQTARIFAPAHPGCAASDENEDIDAIEDVVFHYLEVLDALGLERFDLIGACVGGWIAAEIAARHPEKVRKLVLAGAAGLFVEQAPIGDVFMMAQAERGASYAGLRQMLFARPDDPRALKFFPDGIGAIEEELRRYRMLRFASRIGFRPPYFYHRSLRNRLYRITAPALVLWGGIDNMVPLAHGETYARLLAGVDRLRIIPGAGHSILVEQPDVSAAMISDFLRR